MAYNYEYPYDNPAQENADWIINTVKNLVIEWAQVQKDWTSQQEAFESLKAFVNNYFDNLDVQEEINNKIDMMYQNGELDNLFEKYVNPVLNSQNSRITTLESRMDGFTSLPPGSTSGDAELIDIRTPYSAFNNGEAYPNAGDAVRGQTGSLYQEVIGIKKGNLFNHTIEDVKMRIFEQSGSLLDLRHLTDGWLNGSGGIETGSQKTSDYIPVNPGDVMKVGYIFPNGISEDNQSFFTWVQYDSEYKKTVAFSAMNDKIITMEENTSYVRVSLNPAYFSANIVLYVNEDSMPPFKPFTLTLKKEYIPSTNDIPIVGVDYESITEAINSVEDGGIILILPGVYTEILNLNKKVSLIGFNRDNTIIRSTSYAYANSPLFIGGGVSIKNLTIEMVSTNPSGNVGYGIHLDKNIPGNILIENCKIYNNCGAAIGGGGRYNQNVLINNCDLYCDSLTDGNGNPATGYATYGAMFYHCPVTENILNSNVRFISCNFYSTLNNVITLGSTQDKSQTLFEFINCLFYSYYSKKEGNIRFINTTYPIISESSFGNSKDI